MSIHSSVDIMENKEKLYKNFQDWLNKCPIKVINYLDFTDEFEVTFKLEQTEV